MVQTLGNEGPPGRRTGLLVEGARAQAGTPGAGSILGWLVLALALPLAAALLSFPLRAPIGPMYWDVFTYYDAANRILSGQVPAVDFFTPAGPLGYAIAAAWIAVFPNGQPSLLVHWSIMTVSVPLMALALASMPARSRSLGLWLVLPFLLFSLLPFNGKEFYPFPGSDAFGFYNRQVCLVLFPLVTGFMFVKHRGALIALVTLSMLVLFFLKITGFLAAGLICAFALLAGRVRLRDAVVVAILFCAVLAVLELSMSIVSFYIQDVLVLASMNSDTLVPRLFQSLSINFGVSAALGGLALVLLAGDNCELREAVARIRSDKSTASVAAMLDRPAFWIIAITAAGVLFETQNTGSQAMIFVWPALLAVLVTLPAWVGRPRFAIAVATLAGAAYLPLMVESVERGGRAYVGAVGNVPLEHENLKTLGAVSMRPAIMARSDVMMNIYSRDRAAFEDMAASGEMPVYILYSEFDFQISYLRAVDQAITSIHAIEAGNGIRFNTIMSLNFTNPFPYLMDRHAPLYLTVGKDPFRAVPLPKSKEIAAVTEADLVLIPTCPVTRANLALEKIYAAGLTKHHRIKLDQCFDALVHPKFGMLNR